MLKMAIFSIKASGSAVVGSSLVQHHCAAWEPYAGAAGVCLPICSLVLLQRHIPNTRDRAPEADFGSAVCQGGVFLIIACSCVSKLCVLLLPRAAQLVRQPDSKMHPGM